MFVFSLSPAIKNIWESKVLTEQCHVSPSFFLLISSMNTSNLTQKDHNALICPFFFYRPSTSSTFTWKHKSPTKYFLFQKATQRFQCLYLLAWQIKKYIKKKRQQEAECLFSLRKFQGHILRHVWLSPTNCKWHGYKLLDLNCNWCGTMFLLRVLFLASNVRIPDIHGLKEAYYRHMSLRLLFCRHAKAQNSTSVIYLSLFWRHGDQFRDTQIFNWWLLSLISLGNSYIRIKKLTAGTIMSFL